MKFIEIDNGRMIFKLFGIKIFSHKLDRNGRNNYVVLIKENGEKIFNPKIKGLTVNFRNSCNVVKLYEPLGNIKKININLSGHDYVEIKKSKGEIKNLKIQGLGRSKVLIGEDFSVGDALLISEWKSKIKIGNDCMFSFSIIMQTGDEHVIYDGNASKFSGTNDVIIGNHVWVGYGARILKKSVIPDGCVVGMNAVVTKPFYGENSAIAGAPAKLVKSNIYWERDTYSRMMANKNEAQVLRTIKERNNL